MKRNILTIIAVSAVMTAATACSEKHPHNNRGPVVFTSAISDITRAADVSWHPGDAIGVYMAPQVGGDKAANYTNVNVKHTTVGDGNFAAADPTKAFRLPAGDTPVSFVAYYPHTAAINSANEYTIDVSNQSNLPAIDLHYSDNAKNYAADDPAINKPHLTFRHMLTRVYFTINDQRGTDLTGVKLTIGGLDTRGIFNLSDGSITSVGTPADIVAKVVSVNGPKAMARAIIIPRSQATYTIEVAIPADGVLPPTRFTLNAQEYKPGQRHFYTLNIVDDGHGGAPQMILVDGGGNIVDWNDIGGGTHTPDR